MHLRMTGTLLLDPDPPSRHARVRLDLGDHVLVFDDPRRFGTGELALGPEALAAFFDARLGSSRSRASSRPSTCTRWRRSRAPVKAFLLDQKRIAGVGNIYADEALFRPASTRSTANPLTRAQCAALRDAVVETLLAGLEAKGARSTTSATPTASAAAFRTSSSCTSASTSRPELRQPGAEAARRGPRHVRLRALPAAPARAAPGGLESALVLGAVGPVDDGEAEVVRPDVVAAPEGADDVAQLRGRAGRHDRIRRRGSRPVAARSRGTARARPSVAESATHCSSCSGSRSSRSEVRTPAEPLRTMRVGPGSSVTPLRVPSGRPSGRTRRVPGSRRCSRPR